jgi:hypothetical protein
VARFGPVNLRANQRAFDGDPDLPLLLSLEHYNDETQAGGQGRDFPRADDSSSPARPESVGNRRKRCWSL